MIAEVIYTGALGTSATHVKSDAVLTTDAPEDNHGRGQTFSPTDLTATSLASCMLTIMGIYAENHGIELGKIRAEVAKTMSTDSPRRITAISVTVKVSGRYDDATKKALINAAENCPVAKSLHPDIEQDLEFDFS